MRIQMIELQAVNLADHHLHEKLLKVWWPFPPFLGKSFGKEMQAFTRQISHVIMSQNSIFSPVSWVVLLLREMGHLCTEGPLEAFDCLVPRSIFCRCFVVPSIPSLFGHLLLLWKLGDYCWIPFLKRLQSPFMLLYLHTINFRQHKRFNHDCFLKKELSSNWIGLKCTWRKRKLSNFNHHVWLWCLQPFV